MDSIKKKENNLVAPTYKQKHSPTFKLYKNVLAKEILHSNKNKGIRVSQSAQIPTIFLIGGHH